jgi:plasmid maintenance system killer protein
MIVSFRDDWLHDFFVEDVRSKKIPPDLETRLFRKIQMIDDAATGQDLRLPPSNHFEKLRGRLRAFIQSASTHNGGSSSNGMAAEVRRQVSIWTTIAICRGELC